MWQVRAAAWCPPPGLALWCACGVCLRVCPCGDDVPEVVAGLTCAGIGSSAGGGGACVGAVAVLTSGALACLRGPLLAGLMMAPCRGAVGG